MTPPATAARSRRHATRGGQDEARVLCYFHDGVGLGHVRKTLAVVGEVAARRPDAAFLGLTGAFQTHWYDAPSRFDHVKLPDLGDRHVFPLAVDAVGNATPPTDRDSPARRLRSTIALESANAFAPSVVYVDAFPTGSRGELLPMLLCERAADPPVSLILAMMDTYGEPRRIVPTWRRDGVFEVLDWCYDQILIGGMQEVFDPITEYGFPASVAAKTTFCGYVLRGSPRSTPAEVRARLGVGAEPMVVVTTGGGALGKPLLNAYASLLTAGGLSDMVSVIIAGPMLAAEHWLALAGAVGGLPHVRLLSSTGDYLSHLAAADLVVTMGGWSISEAAALGKRLVTAPHNLHGGEQLVRARGFARLGLSTAVDPRHLSPTSLARAIDRALAAPPPIATIDATGAERSADALVAALERHANAR